MSEYHKINSIYKRDFDTNKLIIGNYSTDEFLTLENTLWDATEKIDGTNIRIEISFFIGPYGMEYNVEYNGRTSRAVIPKHLLAKLKELFDDVNWTEIFSDARHEDHITLYGEGYGHKIQSGSNYCGDEVNFILFDVKYNRLYLQRDSVFDIARKLNINVVPSIGIMTLPDAVKLVKEGFFSVVANGHPKGNSHYIAEGLVLRPVCNLLTRTGDRIIVKVKHKDFVNL